MYCMPCQLGESIRAWLDRGSWNLLLCIVAVQAALNIYLPFSIFSPLFSPHLLYSHPFSPLPMLLQIFLQSAAFARPGCLMTAAACQLSQDGMCTAFLSALLAIALGMVSCVHS